MNAALLSTSPQPEAAVYNGIQLVEPWMVSVDAAKNQVSFNPGQTARNPEGGNSKR